MRMHYTLAVAITVEEGLTLPETLTDEVMDADAKTLPLALTLAVGLRVTLGLTDRDTD